MKRFRVTASYTQPLDVVVLVPNDWDENDVMEYYRTMERMVSSLKITVNVNGHGGKLPN